MTKQALIINLIFYPIFISLLVFLIFLLKDKKTYIKIPETISRKQKIILFIISAITVSLLNVILMHIDYPYAGHDFSLIEGRAMSMMLFGEKNGIFAMEWASPLFGAGLLSYPNPQWHQYSPLYFLTFLMPFFTAYNLLIFIFVLVGFISMFFILKDIFNLKYKICLTGAIIFSVTGYYIYHLRIGHWTFLYHPLTAFIVWCYFSKRFTTALKIILPALTFTAMIYGGALQTIFFYTCFVLLGVAAITFKKNINFIKTCIIIITSVSLSFILSMSKILPSFMLGAKIDRGKEMLNNVQLWKIFEVIYYNLIMPTISFFEYLFFVKGYAKISYRILWEKEIAIPVLILPLTIIILIVYRKNIKTDFKTFFLNNKLKVILIFIWIYITIDMHYDFGIIHTLIPKLNSINLHLRMASVSIIPIIIGFSILLNKYKLARKNRNLFFIIINVFMAVFFLLRLSDIFLYDKNYSNVNVANKKEVWKSIKENPNRYYVDEISDTGERVIIYDFTNQNGKLRSSRLPYEPIYGYELQTFIPKEEGSPYKIIDNKYYNFTHPNSLLFFSDNYPQFTGFTLEEKSDLDKFLNFEKVDYKLPKIFDYANKVSIYSIIIVSIYLLIYIAFCIFKKVKIKN